MDRPFDLCLSFPFRNKHQQPGWTFVGAGIFDIEATKRTTASVIPEGVRGRSLPMQSLFQFSSCLFMYRSGLKFVLFICFSICPPPKSSFSTLGRCAFPIL